MNKRVYMKRYIRVKIYGIQEDMKGMGKKRTIYMLEILEKYKVLGR